MCHSLRYKHKNKIARHTCQDRNPPGQCKHTAKHSQGQKVERVLHNLKSITTYGETYENVFWVVTFTAAQVVGGVHVTRSFHTQFTFLPCHKQLARALACLGVAGAAETPCWIAATLLTPRHGADTREGRSHAHIITSTIFCGLCCLSCQFCPDVFAQWKKCSTASFHSESLNLAWMKWLTYTH